MNFYKGEIVHQVWEAVEENKRMPINERITLERLSKDDDGIFPSERSWRGFIFGNFGAGDGSYYLNGEPSKKLLKKYCYDIKQYKHLFAIHIGGGNYIEVDPENIEFEFTFDANAFFGNSELPTAVEILVKAVVKEVT